MIATIWPNTRYRMDRGLIPDILSISSIDSAGFVEKYAPPLPPTTKTGALPCKIDKKFIYLLRKNFLLYFR